VQSYFQSDLSISVTDERYNALPQINRPRVPRPSVNATTSLTLSAADVAVALSTSKRRPALNVVTLPLRPVTVS
jgi:hypothetical protein